MHVSLISRLILEQSVMFMVQLFNVTHRSVERSYCTCITLDTNVDK